MSLSITNGISRWHLCTDMLPFVSACHTWELKTIHSVHLSLKSVQGVSATCQSKTVILLVASRWKILAEITSTWLKVKQQCISSKKSDKYTLLFCKKIPQTPQQTQTNPKKTQTTTPKMKHHQQKIHLLLKRRGENSSFLFFNFKMVHLAMADLLTDLMPSCTPCI